MRRGSEEPSSELHLEPNLPSCAVQPRNDTVVGAHFGRAAQGPKMDPHRVTRLVERAAVCRGERGWVSKGWTKVRSLTWGR